MKDETVNIDVLTRFQDALDKAHLESIKHKCVQHVNKSPSGAYYISDWFDSSTVASYENGRKL